MGKREYFPAYFSLKRRMRRLTTQEIGEVFLAALEYAETGIETDLEGNAAVAFDFIKEDIDRSNSSYEELCEKRRENGSKGGKASGESRAKHTEAKDSITTDDEANEALASNPKPTKQVLQKTSKPSNGEEEEEEEEEENITISNEIVNAPDGAGDKADSVPYVKIKEHFNTLCPSIGQIRAIEGRRRIQVAARWKDHPSLNEFDELFKTAEASDFLTGKSSDWKATFDWLMIAGNWNKTVEGNYTNKVPKKKEFEQSSFDTDEYMLSALKRTYGSKQEETEETNG